VRYGYKEEVCELWRDAFPDGTPPPTPSPVEVGHGSNKLSTGYIVLIVVSCLTPLEALLAYRYYKKRSKKQDDAAYHAMR